MTNIVKLARIFNVEVKDLFEFNHQKSREDIINEISEIIINTPDEKLKTIYSVIKDIAR